MSSRLSRVFLVEHLVEADMDGPNATLTLQTSYPSSSALLHSLPTTQRNDKLERLPSPTKAEARWHEGVFNSL